MSNSIWRTLQTKTLCMDYTQCLRRAFPPVFYSKPLASHPGGLSLPCFMSPPKPSHPTPTSCPQGSFTTKSKTSLARQQQKRSEGHLRWFSNWRSSSGCCVYFTTFLEHGASLLSAIRSQDQRGKACPCDKSSLAMILSEWRPSCLGYAHSIGPNGSWGKHDRVGRKRKSNSEPYVAAACLKCRLPGLAHKII